MKIELGRYSDILRRLLAGKDQVVAAELAPEISPVFVLESDRPEWAFLGGERLGCVAITQAATALARSTCRIRNPANSNALLVIEELYVGIDTTADQVAIRMGEGTADLATVGIVSVRDRRWGDIQLSAVASRDNAASAGTRGLWHMPLPVNAPQRIVIPVVLPAGSFLEATSLSNNVGVFLAARVRERTQGRYERAS